MAPNQQQPVKTGRYACKYPFMLCSRIKKARQDREIESEWFYETAEPRLQIAGPDLPARCQLISAFQKKSRRTMDRLTPPYKPGARLSTERQAWRESERARSGFGTYLLMRRFPHRLLGIRRASYRSENLRSGYLFIKILEICIKRTCLSSFMPPEVFLCDCFVFPSF